MKKSFFSVVILLIFAPDLNAAPIRSENNLNFPKITSYRSATCGCCKKWVNHLRSSGLEVVDNVVEDISLIIDQYSIPYNFLLLFTNCLFSSLPQVDHPYNF